MTVYVPSSFVVRIAPQRGARSGLAQGAPTHTRLLRGHQVEIWASSPELVAIDEQAGVTVLLHGDAYGADANPRALVKTYLSEGQTSVTSLSGSFALVVVDEQADRVLVATDRFNTRKVFLSEEGNGHWLSSTLAQHPTAHRALSPAGVGSVLSSGVAHSDLTPFDGVHKLRPASLYVFTGGDVSVEPYWSFDSDDVNDGVNAGEVGKHLVEVMRSSVERRLGDSGDVFISLSGGYDSRAVAGLINDLVDDGRRTRSFTYHHGAPVGDTDAAAAAAVAAELGYRHKIVEAYQGDVVAAIAANSAAGEGIANFCMEVDAWKAMGSAMSASDRNVLFVAEIPGMAVAAKGGTPESVLASVDVYPISTVEAFLALLDPGASDALRNGWGDHYGRLRAQAASYPDSRVGHDHLYLDQRLSNTLTLWREKFQMPYVRVANPFLDNAVVDVMLSLPVELRAQKLLYRQAIAEAFPALFQIPISPGGWNAPDWARELRTQSGVIRDQLQSPSRLDELISPHAIAQLLESGLAPAAARGDDLVARLKATVRGSAPLRRVVRTLKPRVQPAVRRKRSWERLLLDLLALRGFLAGER